MLSNSSGKVLIFLLQIDKGLKEFKVPLFTALISCEISSDLHQSHK